MNDCPDPESPPPRESRPSIWRNPFFSACAALSLMFVVTVMALLATTYGDPKAPVNRFLDEHGIRLIVIEVTGILVTGFLAMTLDRWQTLRRDENGEGRPT